MRDLASWEVRRGVRFPRFGWRLLWDLGEDGECSGGVCAGDGGNGLPVAAIGDARGERGVGALDNL